MPIPALREGFRIEPLSKAHNRSAFSCGTDALDHYFRNQVGQDAAKRVAACFVLTANVATVAGFYTLSQYAVDLGSLPLEVSKKLPKYPEVPATLLGRLAVDSSFRGQGLGEYLLLDALYRSWRQAENMASVAVVVDAKNDDARSFYERFEFLTMPDSPRRLFLPMKKIDNLFAG
jgi:ribosomal protein S18 acetylase RimI-like enzyme